MWATLVSRDEVAPTSSDVVATSRRSTIASLAWLADNPAGADTLACLRNVTDHEDSDKRTGGPDGDQREEGRRHRRRVGNGSGQRRAARTSAARDVAVLDREGSDGKEVAEGIGGEFYPVDVTDFAGTEETLQAAVDELGGLHVIVTTAGGGIAKRTMTKTGPARPRVLPIRD